MNRRAAACERSANILLGLAPASLPPAGLAMWAHDRLRDEIRYDAYTARSHEESGGSLPHNDSYTLYGALENGLAVGEGYALAYKRLCDAFGIPCEVVVGLRGGAEHAWNVVQLVDDWYHVDVAGNDQDGDPLDYRWFLKTDVAMQEEYRYQSAQIPACDSGGLTFEVVAERYFPERYARWLDAQTVNNEQLTVNNEEEPVNDELLPTNDEEPGEDEPPVGEKPTGEEEPPADEEQLTTEDGETGDAGDAG
jgi:hypothetical protein